MYPDGVSYVNHRPRGSFWEPGHDEPRFDQTLGSTYRPLDAHNHIWQCRSCASSWWRARMFLLTCYGVSYDRSSRKARDIQSTRYRYADLQRYCRHHEKSRPSSSSNDRSCVQTQKPSGRFRVEVTWTCAQTMEVSSDTWTQQDLQSCW